MDSSIRQKDRWIDREHISHMLTPFFYQCKKKNAKYWGRVDTTGKIISYKNNIQEMGGNIENQRMEREGEKREIEKKRLRIRQSEREKENETDRQRFRKRQKERRERELERIRERKEIVRNTLKFKFK